MNATPEQAQPAPPAQAPIPWYKSPVLVGIATAAAAQLIARVQSKFHVDLAIYGINANDLANWALDTVSGVAIAVATRSRLTSTVAPVTFRKPPSP